MAQSKNNRRGLPPVAIEIAATPGAVAAVQAEIDRRDELARKGWRRAGLSELSRSEQPTEWLIRGWWVAGSYGMLGGGEKTLKSWIAICEALSVASGLPLFGVFEVKTPGPVLIFTGEGTSDLCWKRLRHAGRAMGLSPAEVEALPILVADDIGASQGEAFRSTLELDLIERAPALVIIDPLYTYVGGEVDAGNLFGMGEILGQISSVTAKAEASLKVNQHTRKSASEHPTLTDLTQAGSREWVGSWLLVSHREPPDLDLQVFKLHITVGTRHGYGAVWDLDFDLGPLNLDTLEHEGAMSWSLKASADTQAQVREERRSVAVQDHLLKLRKLGSATASEYAKKYGLSDRTAETHLKDLCKAGKAVRGDGKRYTPETTRNGELFGSED